MNFSYKFILFEIELPFYLCRKFLYTIYITRLCQISELHNILLHISLRDNNSGEQVLEGVKVMRAFEACQSESYKTASHEVNVLFFRNISVFTMSSIFLLNSSSF